MRNQKCENYSLDRGGSEGPLCAWHEKDSDLAGLGNLQCVERSVMEGEWLEKLKGGSWREEGEETDLGLKNLEEEEKILRAEVEEAI